MTWTTDRVELLTKLWDDGLSAGQIAGELGYITRNAVIGKAMRLKLPRRRESPPPRLPRMLFMRTPSAPRPLAPAQRTGQSKPKRKRRAPPTPATFEQAKLNYAAAIAATSPSHADEAPPAKTCTLLELTADTCRWPLGTPGTPGFCFCGGKPLASLPYCAPHARLSYTAAVRLTQEERHLRQEQARREARKLAAEAA